MSLEKQQTPAAAPDTSERASPRRPEPGGRGPRRGGPQADGRRDPGKLRENQARLGVGPEHKTDAMKKGRRGTFP
jgi:hypothetical protein